VVVEIGIGKDRIGKVEIGIHGQGMGLESVLGLAWAEAVAMEVAVGVTRGIGLGALMEGLGIRLVDDLCGGVGGNE
jgi:hypothetical protein